MRAISVIVCVDTTETLDGVISPCKLKFTTKRKSPSGVTSSRGGKKPERGLADEGVVLGRILPDGSERAAVCDRDVIELSIGRKDDAVWSIDIDRHVARIDLVIDLDPRRSKTYQCDLVRAFRQDVNEIVFVGLCL